MEGEKPITRTNHNHSFHSGRKMLVTCFSCGEITLTQLGLYKNYNMFYKEIFLILNKDTFTETVEAAPYLNVEMAIC